jgi:predicted Zn-dependent protease
VKEAINNRRGRLAALALTLALVPAMAEAQTRVKPGMNMFSVQQDVEIGRQSAAQVERQLPMVRNSTVQNYVNGIGQKLAAAAPGPDFNYRFRVVDANDLNAFALPGGYIYLNSGIIRAARSDGEVAGVLAHEIAHVALRHGTHNASKAQMTSVGAQILGSLIGGKVKSNNTAQVINVLGGFGMNALFLKYSRSAEQQADILGAQIMSRAGYNPGDMASFFQTLQRTDQRRTVNWLSSHPAPSNRIQTIERESRLMGVDPRRSGSSSRLARVQAAL